MTLLCRQNLSRPFVCLKCFLLLLIVNIPALGLQTIADEGVHPARENAFASLLCGDDTIPAIEVLAKSIRFAQHTEPFLVIVPSSISSSTITRLSALENTHPLETAFLPYPFNSTANRITINILCRYLKLQLWGLLRWSNIIFLDADTILRRNVAELFEAPGFSAVGDPVGMNFNNGVMVIEPCKYVHSLLIGNCANAGSYNVGDQGALNALVDFEAWNRLPLRNNTFHTAEESTFRPTKILHYSGDAKPSFGRLRDEEESLRELS